MLLTKIINTWFHKNQHLFFKYHNGFYHLNYVANSPLLMLNSFKKMMFCKYNAITNTIHTNSPFNKGFLQYAFLEDGLAILNTELTYKKNVCYHQVISPEAANDYYTLSFNVFHNLSNAGGVTINSVSFSNKKWILTKPSFLSEVSYLKNSYNESILIYFDQKWLNNYIKSDTAFKNSKVKSFFDGEEDIMVWPDNALELSKIAKDIKTCLTKDGTTNPLLLKFKTYELVATFIRQYNPNNALKKYIDLPQKDIVKITKIEVYLLDNLKNKFVGINELSHQFNISHTKLKKDFKAVYGMGIFNYFRQKQMFMAKEFLQSGEYRVKEVAQLFGYENVGKFSKAFKMVNNELPSKIIFTKKQQS
ncbi:helix-turn-helix domain-containing protein [Wenyingzhuangia sp. IMCC45533]